MGGAGRGTFKPRCPSPRSPVPSGLAPVRFPVCSALVNNGAGVLRQSDTAIAQVAVPLMRLGRFLGSDPPL